MGFAVGFAVAGATAASAIGPEIASNLIESHDWRFALRAMGIASGAIVIPIFLIFVTKSPEEIGQFPDGDTEAPAEVELEGEGGLHMLPNADEVIGQA